MWSAIPYILVMPIGSSSLLFAILHCYCGGFVAIQCPIATRSFWCAHFTLWLWWFCRHTVSSCYQILLVCSFYTVVVVVVVSCSVSLLPTPLGVLLLHCCGGIVAVQCPTADRRSSVELVPTSTKTDVSVVCHSFIPQVKIIIVTISVIVIVIIT